MGRQSERIPKGNFYLRTRKNSTEEGIIYIRYFVCGKYVEHSTDIKVPIEHWDAVTQKIRSANKNSVRDNAHLAAIKTKFDKQIMEYNGHITPRMASQILSGQFVEKEELPKKTDFIQYALDYNKQRYDFGKISYSTYDNARLYILQFQRYIEEKTGSKVLWISDLSLSVINNYINWRLDTKHNTKEGINKTLTPLIKAAKYATDNELLPVSISSAISNCYLDIKERNYSSDADEKTVKYLTPDQLKTFKNLYAKQSHERTREIMDMFLFSFYSCGMRVSDIITLEWSHIDFNLKEIKKNIFKTKTSVSIPLTDSALEILNKWKAMNRNERFVFDLLPVNFDLTNAKEMKNARLSKNRTIRQSLHTIGEKMNLSFNLSMHVARHSFAVMALKKGVDIHLISKLMGHKSILVTEKVYAEFMPKDVNTIVREQLSFNI